MATDAPRPSLLVAGPDETEKHKNRSSEPNDVLVKEQIVTDGRRVKRIVLDDDSRSGLSCVLGSAGDGQTSPRFTSVATPRWRR